MSLQEGKEYESIGKHKITIKENFDYEEMIASYEEELSEILGIGNKTPEEREKILKNHQIFLGSTDDPKTMPSGIWHAQSGKCLGGNTWSRDKNWTAKKNKLKDFDINIDTK